MSGIHLSPAAVAALKACSPQAAHKALRRGTFGPPIRRGRHTYVPLAAVEQHIGQPISPEQIARAVAGGNARMITVAEE